MWQCSLQITFAEASFGTCNQELYDLYYFNDEHILQIIVKILCQLTWESCEYVRRSNIRITFKICIEMELINPIH